MANYDSWRFNIFKDDVGIRKVVFLCVLGVIPFWVAFGYDSGVGMAETFLLSGSWEAAMDVYGRSFHFSSYIIYGVLFLGSSWHLSQIGITKTKNVAYSILFVFLNVALFEFTYMALFNHYQLRRSLLSWFVEDFAFLVQYLAMLMWGVWGLLAYLSEGLWLKLTAWPLLLFQTTVSIFLFWIFYPLPTVQATYNGWTSNLLFPQTHYAYVHPTIYHANPVLHTVNLLAKTLFAVTQLGFVRSWQK